jgi:hypothetical protein
MPFLDFGAWRQVVERFALAKPGHQMAMTFGAAVFEIEPHLMKNSSGKLPGSWCES